ncbi:hypothetical protein N8935_06555 [Amylibacter sp.]|nr:hypothetical protein [Amylibacter sp.]
MVVGLAYISIRMPINISQRMMQKLQLAISLKALFRRLIIKHQFKKYKPLMKNGLWRVNNKYASRVGSKHGDFKNYSQIVENQSSSYSKRFKNILTFVLGLNHMFVTGGKKEESASVIYLSRTSELKFFDYQKKRVLTETSNEAWSLYKDKLSLPIFDFFHRPDAILRCKSFGLFRQDQLLQSPTLGIFQKDDQIKEVKRIFDIYKHYIKEQKEPPKPEIILLCFHEVAQLLPQKIRSVYLSRQKEVEDLAQRYFFVKAHGDFNVANILVDENIWLLDNDDVGMSAPSMFDLYNLGLNELFENRSTHILRSIDSGELAEALQQIIPIAVEKPEPSDVRVALFVNYFMRESALISGQILGRVSSNRAIKNWNLFNDSFSWWMDPCLK